MKDGRPEVGDLLLDECYGESWPLVVYELDPGGFTAIGKREGMIVFPIFAFENLLKRPVVADKATRRGYLLEIAAGSFFPHLDPAKRIKAEKFLAEQFAAASS